jgi:branched-chain amino acid transport system permease protein
MLTEVIVGGIMVGAVYALITVGYSMVFGILKLMNFAHGDTYIFGTMICLTLLGKHNFHPVLAICIASIAGGILAFLVELLVYRRLRAAQHRLISMITALGAAYVIQNISELNWGNQVMPFPSIVESKFVELMGVQLSVTHLITLLVAIICITGMILFMRYHRYGKAIDCVSQDMDAASLMGIPINRVISSVYFLGGMLGVVGGVLYSSAYNAVSLGMGFRGTLVAFTAAVIGGIGSLGGALLGGLILGLSENIIGVYISSAYRDPIMYSLLIIMLLVKPTGILGSTSQAKV